MRQVHLLSSKLPEFAYSIPLLTCIFFQAVEEVNRNNIRADERLYELKALQDAKKASEYLKLARALPGYGDVVFPHCACDSRKEGHVLPAVGEFPVIFKPMRS